MAHNLWAQTQLQKGLQVDSKSEFLIGESNDQSEVEK